MTQLSDRETVLRPLTEAEQREALSALEQVRQHREALLAARGGRLFSPAGPLLDELQDERTHELP